MAKPEFPLSLLKYDPPELVTKRAESLTSKFSEDKEYLVESVAISQLLTLEERKQKEQLRKFLNECFPPRTYEDDDGNLWIQYVSKEPEATPMDAISLQNKLDALTSKRQARETGLCPIRRELYDQCFDELIRRIMVDDLDQGYLLARVRDELRKTLGIYEDLYRIGEAFGIRKALETKQLKLDKNAEIEAALAEKEELSMKLATLFQRLETIEKTAIEERPVYKKKHAEELRYAKKLNQQLKAQLAKYTEPYKETEASVQEE